MKDSSGNVLFIILIAVALFAALSYAVSKSTQGSADAGRREASLTDSGVLNQYVSTLRGATARMTASNSVSLSDMEFNPPSDFSNLTSPEVGVFHGSGGAVIDQMAPSTIVDPAGVNPSGQWVFTLHFEVDAVGISQPGNIQGNDLMAFLVGVRQDVCQQVNARLGLPITPFPTETGAVYGADLVANLNTYYMDNDYVLPAGETVIGAGAGDAALSGFHEGCYYETGGGDYVYYAVLTPQ